MSILKKELVDLIYSSVEGDYLALMMFGSYARGDQTEKSDLDVLQLTDRYREPYKKGVLNFSTYNIEHFKKIANEGSLFIYHLQLEGKIIEDRQNILQNILNGFQLKENYSDHIEDLEYIALFLYVDENTFLTNKKKYFDLSLFIIRSWLYAKTAEKKYMTFSVKEICRKECLGKVSEYFDFKYDYQLDFEQFKTGIKIIENLFDIEIKHDFSSKEDLLFYVSKKSDLAFKMGIRLLDEEGDGRISYDPEVDNE